MRRLRDVMYVHSNLAQHEYVYYGMELHEFLRAVPKPMQHIMLLNDTPFGNLRSQGFDLVEGEEQMAKLVVRDWEVYQCGDFCFLDYAESMAPNRLTNQEVAELLYMRHTFSPLGSAFFDTLQNEYAYLGHDDGYFCRLYCRHEHTFADILARKIVHTVDTNKRRTIYPFGEDIKAGLAELCQEGLLVDFSNIFRGNSAVGFSIYVIGKFINMDDMYNNLDRWKARASKCGYVEHKKKAWHLELY